MLAEGQSEANNTESDAESGIKPIGLDAAHVSAVLGISQSHFFALLRSGRFGPQARRLGRAKRYDREEVLTWFRAGCPSRARWRAMRGGGR